ncbi:ABC transporter substrate-binding protein [Halobacteriovorax sp. HLS]|uniref:substrate-binding periplasmic protein n=1 Tax=Halobacteriovorax sp. HLS TaxID=2234000 RepID=UPI000FD7A8D3|nr:transporter substrate-binding domain-containing protein [Halobacteriovorax sp. HLS]
MKLLFYGLIFLFNFNTFGYEVRVATVEWPPYVTGKKSAEGSSVEIIRNAYAKVGHSVKLVFLPWARAINYMKSGKIDAIMPIYKTKDREDFMYFSNSFQRSDLLLYKNTKSKIKYSSLKDLEGLSIGLVNGYKNIPYIDNSTTLKKTFVTKDLSNLKMLARSHVDVVCVDSEVAKQLIAENRSSLEGKIEPLYPALDSKELFIAFSIKAKGSKKMLKDFNHGLSLLK